MAHLNPKPEDVAVKVPDLRLRFEEKYADAISGGKYDSRDVDRLKTEDAYARCFLRTLAARDDVEKAIDIINTTFLWRKEIGLGDMSLESISPALLEKASSAIYYKGETKEGHPILYINVKANDSVGEELELVKKYIAFKFEEHQKKSPETMCVALLDMHGASTSNVKLDITKFILACFSTYFPAFMAYLINYEMPFLVSATWKIISAFLSSEQKQKLLQLNKKTITNHISDENLWEHMK